MNNAGRVFSNVLAIAFVSALGLVNVIYTIPKLSQLPGPHPFLKPLSTSILIFYLLFLWCWIYTATVDPGRVRDDLHRRGFLDDILHGDIPHELSDMPICKKCNIPCPPQSSHCNDCGHCFLRHDHHCDFTACCIADRNIKSFVLGLVYAVIYGFLNAGFALTGFLTTSGGYYPTLCFISALYCVCFSIMFGMFAWTTLEGSMRPIAAIAGGAYEPRTWRRLLGSFGDHWWERVVPIQRKVTELAWGGVEWDEQPRFI
jgi:ribosomal protein L40E